MMYHAVNELFSSVTQSAKLPCCEWSVSIGHTVCNMTTLRMKCFHWSVQSHAVKGLSRLVTKLITKPRYEWSVSIGHEAHYNITQSFVRFDWSSSLQRHHAINGDVLLVTKLSTMECFGCNALQLRTTLYSEICGMSGFVQVITVKVSFIKLSVPEINPVCPVVCSARRHPHPPSSPHRSSPPLFHRKRTKSAPAGPVKNVTRLLSGKSLRPVPVLLTISIHCLQLFRSRRRNKLLELVTKGMQLSRQISKEWAIRSMWRVTLTLF